nr:glycoside hydrolase family 3 C-terminal domain-containing protein [Tanacetum cinerariifolium]
MAKLLQCVFTFLVICCWATTAESNGMRYKDPKQPVEVRITDLMNRMTLEEKIGQMTQIDRYVATPEVMQKFFIGSVLTGGASPPAKETSPEAWINMVNDFQIGSMSTPLEVPMMYGIDAVHGNSKVLNATIFPHNIGLGVTRQVKCRDTELIKKIGAATALEVRATGINYAFAPCVAVCRDPRWGRCFESFSEDPNIVRAMTEIIPGLQGDINSNGRLGVSFVGEKDKVASCAKHYVGDGGTTRGINENNTKIDIHTLMKIHMPPYIDSVRKGVASIMISYSSLNGVKMHRHRHLITEFLKKTLKFKGFVISDFMGVDKMTNPPHANYTWSIQHSVMAGIDMIMVGFDYPGFISRLKYLVKNNCIPISRINDAVRRILRVKFIMGLFEDPFTAFSMGKYLGNQDHRDLAREARVVDPTTEVVYVESPTPDFIKSNNFSYAIVVTGEFPYSESAGDSQDLTIPEPGPTTIMNVCGSVKCVVVLMSGRPVVMEPYIPSIDALVAAWLPGTEGQGVTDVLFGDYGFTGKLAHTWFKSVDQLPMNVGDLHYDPLYPFGFGLTTEPSTGY